MRIHLVSKDNTPILLGQNPEKSLLKLTWSLSGSDKVKSIVTAINENTPFHYEVNDVLEALEDYKVIFLYH